MSSTLNVTGNTTLGAQLSVTTTVLVGTTTGQQARVTPLGTIIADGGFIGGLTGNVTGNLTGNVAMGGTATFTVPVLDTQEFYQGILNPLPLQAFDYYLQQGFPPQLLFDLFPTPSPVPGIPVAQSSVRGGHCDPRQRSTRHDQTPPPNSYAAAAG